MSDLQNSGGQIPELIDLLIFVDKYNCRQYKQWAILMLSKYLPVVAFSLDIPVVHKAIEVALE